MRINQRRLILVGLIAAMLIIVLIIITSCVIKPDRTIDDPVDPNKAVLPFQTATPTPSPAPPSGTDGQSGWQPFTSGDPAVITPAPTPVATIQLITASPTPVPTASPTPKPTATPTKKPDDGTLRNGSTGSAVRQLQQKLKDLGYYSGSVDGDFGNGTETALRDFQKANGLYADGIAGTQTLNLISSGKAKSKATTSGKNAPDKPELKSYTPSTLAPGTRYLQLGGSGSEVKKLQTRLKELGYYTGSVSGTFDYETETAVMAFQKRNGCWPDGVAGQDTQDALFSNKALPASGK